MGPALAGQHNCCVYIDNLGGTVSARQPQLPGRREIILSAQHLPGKDNTTADQELREMKDCSDWMLSLAVLSILGHFSNFMSIYLLLA